MKKICSSDELACPECGGELEYFEGYGTDINESFAEEDSRYNCPACGKYYRVVSHYILLEHEYFDESKD